MGIQQLHVVALLCTFLMVGCTTGGKSSTDAGSDAAGDTAGDTTPDPDVGVADTQDTATPEDTFIEDSGPPPDLGPPADPQVCSGQITGHLQSFGGACCYTPEAHPNNPDCVWYSENYNDGACLDAQCAEGYCSLAKYCTKGCSFLVDQSNNHTGAEESDGIQDTTLPDDCAIAADGPYGMDFHCVNVNPPFQKVKGRCRPGTTFKPCEASTDCPGDESCQLLYVLGETQARCMTAHQDAVGLADACNSDPNESALVPCRGPFCNSWGCTELCDDEATCATDTCQGGACTKAGTPCAASSDCSALTCDTLKPWSNQPFTDGFCEPKRCKNDAECVDPDWFCRPYWNGASKVEDVAYDPACRRRSEGAAIAGEACGYAGDGTDYPECSYYYGCINNICSSPCEGDTDCPGALECFLGNTWNIDVDDDDETDTYVNLDLCQEWPHEGDLTDCTSDADCPGGEHCEFRVQQVEGAEEGEDQEWNVGYKCRADYENQVSFGETCGSGTDKICDSDLCLVASSAPDGTPSLCTKYCDTTADCPETVFYDGFTWKTTCLSFNVNKNQSLDPIDDVYVGYCWITSSVGSVSNCDETKTCEGDFEYCRAHAIAGNPDEPVTVEHLCLDFSQGLDAVPTAKVGEPCETWKECEGRRCMNDGADGGYCSQLCAVDADCQSPEGLPNLLCTKEVILERPNPEHSGVTTRCIMAKECLPCGADNDCGGDYICMNIGGLGALAEMRCASPCTAQDKCANESLTCIDAIDGTGTLTGSSGCKPEACE